MKSNIKKSIIYFAVYAILIVTISGCGKKNEEKTDDKDITNNDITTEVELTSDEATKTEEYLSEMTEDITEKITSEVEEKINYENYGEDSSSDIYYADMGGELNSLMGFDKLGLYYDVSMQGIDGENFIYSVYLENGFNNEKFEEIQDAINEFVSENNNDIYVDVFDEDEKIFVYLDLGNAKENDNTAINGVLKSLNNVSGISKVIINEDFDFPF